MLGVVGVAYIINAVRDRLMFSLQSPLPPFSKRELVVLVPRGIG
jgi:hypothetical protein